jgi:hypothetical protein
MTCCYLESLDKTQLEEAQESPQMDSKRTLEQLALDNGKSRNDDLVVHVQVQGAQLFHFVKYEQWSLATLVWVIIFKIVFSIAWFGLQGFLYLVTQPLSFFFFFWSLSPSLIPLASSKAENFIDQEHGGAGMVLVLTAIFQVGRTFFINLLIAINMKIPVFLESAYFAHFSIQTVFFFYYRNLFKFVSGKSSTTRTLFSSFFSLFFSVSLNQPPFANIGWVQTVGASVVVFLFAILVYPVNMSERFYNFRFRTLNNLASNHKKLFGWMLPFVDGDRVSHEQHITNLVVVLLPVPLFVFLL